MLPACARPTAPPSSTTMFRPPPTAGRAHRAAGGMVVAKSNTPEFGAGGCELSTRSSGGRPIPGTRRSPAAAPPAGVPWRWPRAKSGWRMAPTTPAAAPPAAYFSWSACAARRGASPVAPSNNLYGRLRAGPDGAQRSRPRALPRRDGRVLPARSADVRRASHALYRAVAAPVAPRRIAFTADFGGNVPMELETRHICAQGHPPLRGTRPASWQRPPISATPPKSS